MGPPRFERGTYGFLRMTAPEFRHSLSGSSPSERDTALMGVSFLEPVVILDPIDRSVDRLARLRPHGLLTMTFQTLNICVFASSKETFFIKRKLEEMHGVGAISL